MEIRGKVALVTGGAVRLGQAISFGLAKEGVKVAVHYHHSTQAAEETVAGIESLGGRAVAVKGDFRRVSEIESVVQNVVRLLGGLDILINNAADYFQTPLGQTDENQWDRLLDLNLKAPYFCAQAAADVMTRQKGGKIINISDVAAISPWPDFIPYCASKAGLISVTKGLAKALAPDIQVNTIASGTVLMQDDAPSNYRTKIAEQTLLKRIGSPADIVKAIIFLLRDGDYITGEVLGVDGGRLLGGS
ncbi:SDR family oxidoreductase [bacterium]|nr:SDR family oxidoreductase [bacterium]